MTCHSLKEQVSLKEQTCGRPEREEGWVGNWGLADANHYTLNR